MRVSSLGEVNRGKKSVQTGETENGRKTLNVKNKNRKTKRASLAPILLFSSFGGLQLFSNC
jgi:hypothetical protein